MGGVLLTLAPLCSAYGIDMEAAGEAELARVWTKIDKIRVKQATKRPLSPLPNDLDPNSPAAIRAERDALLDRLKQLEQAA